MAKKDKVEVVDYSTSEPMDVQKDYEKIINAPMTFSTVRTPFSKGKDK